MQFKLRVSFIHFAILAFSTIICFTLLYRDLAKLRAGLTRLQMITEGLLAHANSSIVAPSIGIQPVRDEHVYPGVQDGDGESVTSDEFRNLLEEMRDIDAESSPNLPAGNGNKRKYSESSYSSDSDSSEIATLAQPEPDVPDIAPVTPDSAVEPVETAAETSPEPEGETKTITIADKPAAIKKSAPQAVAAASPLGDISFKVKSQAFNTLSESDLKKKNVLELKEYLKSVKQPTTGSKPELIERIMKI